MRSVGAWGGAHLPYLALSLWRMASMYDDSPTGLLSKPHDIA